MKNKKIIKELEIAILNKNNNFSTLEIKEMRKMRKIIIEKMERNLLLKATNICNQQSNIKIEDKS